MDGGADLSVAAIAEALEQFGRPLDVGEEERDRPGRQAGHKAASFRRLRRGAVYVKDDVRRWWRLLLDSLRPWI